MDGREVKEIGPICHKHLVTFRSLRMDIPRRKASSKSHSHHHLRHNLNPTEDTKSNRQQMHLKSSVSHTSRLFTINNTAVIHQTKAIPAIEDMSM